MSLYINILLFLLALSAFAFSGKAQKPGASIDIQHYQFSIELNDGNDSIKCNAVIELKLLKDTGSVELDLVGQNSSGKGMHIDWIQEDNQPLLFTHYQDKVSISLKQAAKKGALISITIKYKGIPADGLIISTNKYNQRTFFGDNWPNRAHNWLPCVDHPADKASVDFIITAPDHYQIISNGIKTEETNLSNHLKITRYQETVPLPTKVMVIGAADFAVNYAGDVECVPVYSWVYPQNKEKGFYDYAQAKDILPFFIQHIGPYAYRKLANVQSKTRFGGMENASAIFYFENSVQGDRRAEALLAHEIAHQWFGNSATEKDWPHLWLSEGFATYMTHLYLENKYGLDTLIKRMKADREKVLAFSKERNKPVIDSSENNNLMKLLNANSYQKGGWVLHMLRRKLGDSLFWKGIQAYYREFAGRNASTEDFRGQMEMVSGLDLKEFFQQWLYRAGQPALRIDWKFIKKEKQISISILQTQDLPFSFPLQIAILEGVERIDQTVWVKDKITKIKIPSKTKPTELLIDPYTNLLFDGVTQELR